MRRSFGLGLVTLLLTLPMAASAQEDDPNLVIAPPEDEILVRGGPFPRCFKRRGDPLDALRETAQPDRQQWVDPNGGKPRLVRDPNPVTGPDIWQRAGRGLTAYIFRAPTDGTPMCIGNRSGGGGHGQLRRILDARPYAGKYARFTAFIATPPNIDVRVWFAGGNSVQILVGDRAGKNVTGTGRWEPVSVTLGPIPRGVTKLSYGFLLSGNGDVWVAQPKLEFLDERPEDTLPKR